MIHRLAAVALGLHGMIHLIGFVSPWRIAALDGFAYRTTILGGAQDIGDAGVRLIGLVWLGLTVGFVAAGYGVWRGRPWALGLTGVLAVVSLIVCVVGLPETAAGVAIDVVILATASYLAFRKSRSLGPMESRFHEGRQRLRVPLGKHKAIARAVAAGFGPGAEALTTYGTFTGAASRFGSIRRRP